MFDGKQDPSATGKRLVAGYEVFHLGRLTSHWGAIRGQARQWWSEFTDEDLDEIAGRRERLVAMVERRYGRSRSEAEAEVNRFLVRAGRVLGAGAPKPY